MFVKMLAEKLAWKFVILCALIDFLKNNGTI